MLQWRINGQPECVLKQCNSIPLAPRAAPQGRQLGEGVAGQASAVLVDQGYGSAEIHRGPGQEVRLGSIGGQAGTEALRLALLLLRRLCVGALG